MIQFLAGLGLGSMFSLAVLVIYLARKEEEAELSIWADDHYREPPYLQQQPDFVPDEHEPVTTQILIRERKIQL